MSLFVDSHGDQHRLDGSLRDRLKPAWRSMVDPELAARAPSEASLHRRVRAAASQVAEARSMVAAFVATPLGGRVLEVGCYDGAISFELARDPGTRVVASDLGRYYVVQRPGHIADREDAPGPFLDELRERVRAVAAVPPGAVEFVEDDLVASRLDPGTFDAIVSFEVLEHVLDPGAAFSSMARLLRPAGIACHVYNPFASVIGGHSLCTLDFPWGHARLDRRDFERYLAEVRPTEAAQALRFYTESLNRMTLADLRGHVAASGLELLALLPWHDRALASQVTPDILAQTRRNLPTATTEDLLATFVTVVARRPALEAIDDPRPEQLRGGH